MTPWDALGVSQDIAVADLRRRYAALIKEFRPETHPQDFARIREAYETALPFARRREIELEQARDAETPAEPLEHPVETVDLDVDEAVEAAPLEPVPEAVVPLQIVDTVPLGIDDEIAGPVTTIAVLPEFVDATPEPEPEPQAREPDLAEHFRRFHALAESATGTNDETWLPELRSLLQARAKASLDDSQALEFALTRWFIESPAPPLTLLFEAGRAFDWHAHVMRLSAWLSPWALRQMEARLALSRDLVHARHFSGNALLRQLHSPQPGARGLVFRPWALEAQAWAERWRHASEDADAIALADQLDARALARMRGFASTDLLAGLAAAAFARSAISACGTALVVTTLVFLARKGLQAIGRLPQAHPMRRLVRFGSGNLTLFPWRGFVPIRVNKLGFFGFGAAIAAIFGYLLVATPSTSPLQVPAGALLLVPGVLFFGAALWQIAAYLELVVALVFEWREAVDRLEFDRFTSSRAMPTQGPPFGARLHLADRLRSIPPAMALQAREIAQRERPARARPSGLLFRRLQFTNPNGKLNWTRLLWFGAWIVFVIMRFALHASRFGG